MSLEQMNKSELVTSLRTANQDNKALQARVAELEAAIEASSNDNIGNSAQEVADLPYLAVSQFREAQGKGGYAIRVRFDLNGNSKVVSNQYFNEHYKTNWEAVKILETEVEVQKEVVPAVQQEGSDG